MNEHIISFKRYEIPDIAYTPRPNIFYHLDFLGLINSVFKGKILMVSFGSSSDVSKEYSYRIDGVTDLGNPELSKTYIIHGKYHDEAKYSKQDAGWLEKDFIGFVTLKDDGTIDLRMELNPKVKQTEVIT